MMKYLVTLSKYDPKTESCPSLTEIRNHLETISCLPYLIENQTHNLEGYKYRISVLDDYTFECEIMDGDSKILGYVNANFEVDDVEKYYMEKIINDSDYVVKTIQDFVHYVLTYDNRGERLKIEVHTMGWLDLSYYDTLHKHRFVFVTQNASKEDCVEKLYSKAFDKAWELEMNHNCNRTWDCHGSLKHQLDNCSFMMDDSQIDYYKNRLQILMNA